MDKSSEGTTKITFKNWDLHFILIIYYWCCYAWRVSSVITAENKNGYNVKFEGDYVDYV